MSTPYADLPSYQQRVADFVGAHDMRASGEARLLDLTAEVGELAKEALRATRYGREPLITDERWDDELGDVFFSLVSLANATGVDLEKVLEAALAKYAARIARRGNPASGR